MTNKEAIKTLEKIREKLVYQGAVSYSNKDVQALIFAITILKRIKNDV